MMKKRLISMTALSLAAAVSAGMFAGCGTKKETASATAGSSSAPAATAKAEVKKPEKIKAFLDIVLPKEQGQAQWAAEFEKLTGIKLEINQPAHNQYYDVMNVTFASGDVPDIVEIADANYLRYAAQGALYDITKLYDNSSVLKNATKEPIDAMRVNNKLFGIPLNSGGGCVTFIRQDWLNNLGLKVPTNYEELMAVAKAFAEKDPDKNGKNDTMGYTAVLVAEGKLQEQYLRDFYWGSSPDFTKADGKWIDGFSSKEYQAALERTRKAYADKLLDQELFTNQTSTCRDKLASGKVGIFPYWNNYWANRLEDTIKQTSDKNAKLVPIPAIKETYYLNRTAPAIAITTKSANPDGMFKYFLEYMHDGDQGQTLFTYGAENVHWKKNDAGKVEMLPFLNNAKQLFDKAYVGAADNITPFKNGYLVPVDARETAARDAFSKNFKQMQIFPVSDTYTKNAKDIDKLRQEVAGQIIIGKVTVEQGMERYKKDSAAMGIDKILADFNAAK